MRIFDSGSSSASAIFRKKKQQIEVVVENKSLYEPEKLYCRSSFEIKANYKVLITDGEKLISITLRRLDLSAWAEYLLIPRSMKIIHKILVEIFSQHLYPTERLHNTSQMLKPNYISSIDFKAEI